MIDPAAFAVLLGLSCGLIFLVAQLIIIAEAAMKIVYFLWRLVTFPVRLVWRLI